MLKDLQRIEYHEVLSAIAKYSITEGARRKLLSLAPLSSKKEIERRQKLILDIKKRKESSVSKLYNLYKVIEKKIENGFLFPEELLSFSKGFEEFERFKQKMVKFKDEISEIAESIDDTRPIKNLIDNVIDENALIRDEASFKLKEIRKEIHNVRREIQSILKKEIKKNPFIFWDENLYFKDGRYVLALKREYESSYKGVIIDYSETGHTAFVEPFEAVELNNRLKHFLDWEKKEEMRILKDLNKKLDKSVDIFLKIKNFIEQIDFLNAVKEFSGKIKATIPIISDKFYIKEGRHPVLLMYKKEVVPFDLEMKKNVLLVSGPNAGGKTVLLKSIGLITAMALSGLPVPVAEGTEIPLFENIFVDLGDEQSIDENLSTFTAHLLNIKRIIESANSRTLVLLDEIGTSTSPNEGTALGAAILEVLSQKGATVIATTHLGGLKIFVESRNDMLNAGMGWDKGPTYKLLIGLPGTSNAIEVSERIGLDRDVVEKARKYADEKFVEVEKVLRKLTEAKDQVEKEAKELSSLKIKYETTIKKYTELIDKLKKRIKEIERTYAEKKRKELIEKRKEIENLIKEIKETQASRESILKVKKFFEQSLKRIEPQVKEDIGKFKEGDNVLVKKWKLKGVIVGKENGGYLVNIEGKKILLTGEELEKIEERKRVEVKAEYCFNPVLNIRGMSVEDAKLKLIEFIDEAWSVGVEKIWVLHGKGKGILRRMVKEVAQNDPRIREVRLGEIHEGGAGVTVLSLC